MNGLLNRTDGRQWVTSVMFVLAICFQTAATPTVGRLVSGLPYYPWVRSDFPKQYTSMGFSVPDSEYGDVTYYVEVTNVADVAFVKPMLTYGLATDEDVVLDDPAIYTSAQLKESVRQEFFDDWEANEAWYEWDFEKQEVIYQGSLQEVFGSFDDYLEFYFPGLSCDEDYWPDIDNAPVSNRCWVAFVLKSSGKKSPTRLTFSVGVEGSPVKPYFLYVFGSDYDENTCEWARDERGWPMYGVYSTNYIKRALGVEVLWIKNAYRTPIVTQPYAGGPDVGNAYVTFGGSNSIEICFNAPMVGTYYLDGDFPYDYSYILSNPSLNWTTDTPGATVNNMRAAGRTFPHLYQIQFCVDRAGPCVLKSPIANNVIYAAIPYKPGQPRPSYPGMLSTDSNGNKYGSTTVSISFVPTDTNSVFVATSALQYDVDMNMQSCGTVSLPKVWLQGEEVIVDAIPYDGYEFDHWEWSSELDTPAGVDLNSRKVRFMVDDGFFDDENHYRKIALKATWKRPEHPALPSSFVNRILSSGKFDTSYTAETIRYAMACNGKNTVEECYIAGIDPENEMEELKVFIELVDGVPKISWFPALNGLGEKEGVRKYTIWGSSDLRSWCELCDGAEVNFNFFKVTVGME